MLRAVILVSLSTVVLCAVDCRNEDVRRQFGPFVYLFYRQQDGSSLTRCNVNRQQCCSQIVLDFVNHALSTAINNETIISRFTASAFATAQNAIDEMRDKTDKILRDITENNIRPLLLSLVKPPTTGFRTAVDKATADIDRALNGNKVDLKNTVLTFFRAVAIEYYNSAVEFVKQKLTLGPIKISLPTLDSAQERCAIDGILKQIYTHTDGTDQLIDLFQSISTALKVIKELPPLYDPLIVKLKSFKFSQTCIDVFMENFLCPFCSNQPKMCPGRCSEIIIGCLSPLNQVVGQLDASFKLIASIVNGMIGSAGKATKAVDINRIPILYDRIIASLKRFDFVNFDFIKQILTSCGVEVPALPTLPPLTLPVTLPPVTLPVTLPPLTLPVTLPPVTLPVTLPPLTLPPVTLPPVTLPPVTLPPVTLPVTLPPITLPPVTIPRNPFGRFGKRDIDSIDEYLTKKYKRQLSIPQVKIDMSLFDKLKNINNLASDQIANAIERFCSPNYSVPISNFEFKITAENGNCSYGIDNVGTYNSTFNKKDVVDQVNENPAGHFNYTQLIDEAKNHTYVVTEMFEDGEIPKSMFSMFLPEETLPTTTFQDVPPKKRKINQVKYMCYPTPPNYVYGELKHTNRKKVDYVCYPRDRN